MFRPWLAEYVATTIKKGSHVLVEGKRPEPYGVIRPRKNSQSATEALGGTYEPDG